MAEQPAECNSFFLAVGIKEQQQDFSTYCCWIALNTVENDRRRVWQRTRLWRNNRIIIMYISTAKKEKQQKLTEEVETKEM